MKIIVASSAGFCMGVRRAVEEVLRQLSSGEEDVLTLGPLIHNPQAIDMLSKKKVRVIDSPEEYTGGTLVVRTHGITPARWAALEGRCSRLVDATCPRVKRVQRIIQRHAGRGFAVVIVGDPGHPEVEGLLGYADGNGTVVSSAEDARALPVKKKIAVVGQTTLERNMFEEIASAVREKAAECVVVDTLCDSTSSRQDELKALCPLVDAVIVVGGKQSANTKRLVQIARDVGKPAFHIETEEELSDIRFEAYSTVGVTAGTSTPYWMINRVVDRLEEIAFDRRGPMLSLPGRLLKAAIRSNAMVALGGGFLSAAACAIVGVRPSLIHSAIVVAYLFGMHLLNQLSDMRALEINHPSRIVFFRAHRGVLLAAGAAGTVAALGLSGALGRFPFLIVLTASVIGLAYNVKIPRLRLLGRFARQGLRDIPGSKELMVAAAWGTVTVGVPWVHAGAGRAPFAAGATALIYVSAMAFFRTMLMNIREMQGDRMLGRETFPTLLGERGARRISAAAAVGAGVLLAVMTAAHSVPSVGWLLLWALFYTVLVLTAFYRRTLAMGIFTEGVIDAGSVLAGLLALAWRFAPAGLSG